MKLLSWFIVPDVSPLTVQTEHRHAGGTVEDGVTAGQTLRPTRLLRACWSFSAIVSEQEDTTTRWRHPVIDLGVLDEQLFDKIWSVVVLPSSPGVHPGLVSVVLVGVIQQLVIGQYDPPSPPLACGAACGGNRRCDASPEDPSRAKGRLCSRYSLSPSLTWFVLFFGVRVKVDIIVHRRIRESRSGAASVFKGLCCRINTQTPRSCFTDQNYCVDKLQLFSLTKMSHQFNIIQYVIISKMMWSNPYDKQMSLRFDIS